MIRRWGVAALALLLGLLLRGPALLSRAMGNVGMAALRNALVFEVARPDASLQPGDYPLYDVLPEHEARPPVAMLRRGLALDSASPTARWGLGRAALATGDAATAAEALQPLSDRAKRNPLLYYDALTTFSYGGGPAEVIALYEAIPPPERTRAVSDTVALAYLDLVAGGQGDRGTRGQGDKGTRRGRDGAVAGAGEGIVAGRSVCQLPSLETGTAGWRPGGCGGLQRNLNLFLPGGGPAHR